MENENHEFHEFDLKLAIECSNAYSDSTGLGCTVFSQDGEILHEVGFSCSSCSVCSGIGIDKADCVKVHSYGTSEAERFGGKYVYFCPMGLNCFVSPIVGQEFCAAKVTVGPFRMIDMEDFVAYDLKNLHNIGDHKIDEMLPLLRQIPYVEPSRVNSLSTLLFMAVGFMNNVSVSNRMLESQSSDQIQGQINDYIVQLKNGNMEDLPPYPFETERELLASVTGSDKSKSLRLLNELLGHIIFSSGGDIARIKTRIYELLIVLSRAAVESGAPPDYMYQLTHEFFIGSYTISHIDHLCFNLTKITNRLIDCVFSVSDIRNTNVMHKAIQYMRQNYFNKVSLNSVAKIVDLSPSYFSKIFKKEMGCNFNTYLNIVRIEKSIALLRYENLTLANIATAVGFEDQSYFTKVFKRITGIPPHLFIKSRGRNHRAEYLNLHQKGAYSKERLI
ncbi:MAG: PocR ligand-binding domain-containing protein [Synergistaceae bacterium]|jgi:AraC-like DNA-binding protein/ligand-binding sensor protein|nr:PocR ligand-binding domain-containing protein [Synergistaceae bacterium]